MVGGVGTSTKHHREFFNQMLDKITPVFNSVKIPVKVLYFEKMNEKNLL